MIVPFAGLCRYVVARFDANVCQRLIVSTRHAPRAGFNEEALSRPTSVTEPQSASVTNTLSDVKVSIRVSKSA